MHSVRMAFIKSRHIGWLCGKDRISKYINGGEGRENDGYKLEN